MTEASMEQNHATAASRPDADLQDALRNPYVGPRTFTLADRNWYFGREREARDLLALVIAERLTLFYAQSGAGKSSLLNTQLIPALREEARYLVLPVGRVGGELPAGIDNVTNIYTFNLLLSLDQNKESVPARLAQMTLTNFLAGLRTRDGQHYRYDEATAQRAAQARPNGQTAPRNQPPHVLVIDQFEELVTTHPQRWREREAFFQQLGEAMRADPLLWVVLTLREDFIAPLDPFAHLVPGSLTNRFYMQRMGMEAALAAIKRPAEKAGRPFADGVAEILVDNLRRIKVAGQVGEQLGQYIEPVQLQVVCYQLWENLAERNQGFGKTLVSTSTSPITHTDLKRAGDVDTALADFYEDAIQAALQVENANVSARWLRTWFDEQLITEAGTRGTVYRGDETTAGMPNTVVDALQQRFLLRTELRAGGAWVELVHDRFVEPILKSNFLWSQQQEVTKQKKRIRLIRQRSMSLWGDTRERILHGKVLPIISQSFIDDLLVGNHKELAAAYAASVEYPFNESSLEKVSQFSKVARVQHNRLQNIIEYFDFVKNYLYGLMKAKNLIWADEFTYLEENFEALTVSQFSLELLRSKPMDHLYALVDLPFPVYITTSYYQVLENLLQNRGKDPVSKVYNTHHGLPPFITNYDYQPTPEKPLVYHLYGLDRFSESVILTADEQLGFLVQILRSGIPSALASTLESASPLLIGYDRQNWDFKTIIEALLKDRDRNSPLGIVQVETSKVNEELKKDIYLDAHFSTYGLKIFRGTQEDLLDAMYNTWVQ